MPPILEPFRRTVADAHRRLDALEAMMESSAVKAVEHTAALRQVTDAIIRFEATMNKVVADNEGGREMFEKLANAFLRNKTGEYLRLTFWGLLLSTPTWGPFIWKLFHA